MKKGHFFNDIIRYSPSSYVTKILPKRLKHTHSALLSRKFPKTGKAVERTFPPIPASQIRDSRAIPTFSRA